MFAYKNQKVMQHNRKNILFKALAKNFRRIKEIRASEPLLALSETALMMIVNREFPDIVDAWSAQKIITDYKGDMRCLCPLKLIVYGEVRESMKKAFADFLKKRQLFVRFNEYRGNDEKNLFSPANKELSANVLYWLSSSGFYWTDTREGFDFWCKVNEEWRDFCLTTTILDDSDEIRQCVRF